MGFIVLGVLHSYAEYATIDGIKYELETYNGINYANISATIPNQEKVIIPKSITYNGKEYYVKIDGTILYYYIKGSNIKDLYIETDSIDEKLTDIWATTLHADGVIHVSEKLFDKTISPTKSTSTTQYRTYPPVTDGKRIMVYCDPRKEYGYYRKEIDGITYGLKSEAPYDKPTAFAKSYSEEIKTKETLHIPSEVEIIGFNMPVTEIASLGWDGLKDVYFTSAIPNSGIPSNYSTAIHVPDSLFERACNVFEWQTVTNGKDIVCKSKSLWEDTQEGIKYKIWQTSKSNHFAEISAFPNVETLKIPAEINYNGNKYQVNGHFKIENNPSWSADSLRKSLSNLKDVYLTSHLPYISVWNENTTYYYFPNKINIHVPDSLYDKAVEVFGQYNYVTNGTDWTYKNGRTIYKQDEYTYDLYLPYKQQPYAVLQEVPNTATVKVPATIKDDKTTYIVSDINKISGNGIKDLYLTRCLPSNRGYIQISSDATVHVPDSLFDKSLNYFKTSQGYYWVTDENRTARYEYDIYHAKANGFILALNGGENASQAVITDYTDEEIVYFPEKVTYNKKEYPVSGISVNRNLKEKVKEVHFSNIISSNLGKGKDGNLKVVAYVPDSLFSKAIDLKKESSAAQFTRISAEKDWAISIPFYKGVTSYYDVDGNGNLDIFTSVYDKATNKTNFCSVSLDGKIIKKSQINYAGSLMDIYDKDGLPIILSHGNYTNGQYDNIWSYAKDEVLVKDFNWKTATVADINGDGRKEIIGQLKDGYIDYLQLMDDGTFDSNKLYATTDTTEIKASILDNYTPNTSTIGNSNSSTIGSLADGMFVKARPHMMSRAMGNSTGDATAADMNGDNMVDLTDNKNIYYNLGNNKFFKSGHNGTVFSTDLTGNGLLDFVDFSSDQVSLYLNMVDGKESKSKTLLKNAAIKNVFFGDFDKDGDVDILLTIPGTDYQIFQFYRNDGNGEFKAKDTNIDGKYELVACNDYDSDGLYEMLASTYDSSSRTTDYSLIRINKDFTVSKEELGIIETIADVNNDGITEVISYNGEYMVFSPLKDCKKNTCPEKMSKPSAVSYPDTGKLKISWAQGKDAETSDCDLTYELRIGSEPGKGDIYLGRANSDGTRRVIDEGNMGHSLKYLFDTSNLSEGKYYIALQAVDANGLGGAWSEDLVYDHKLSAPCIAQIPTGYCTNDTVTLYVQNPVNGANYEWKLENGEIISSNANSSTVKAIFHRAGKQSINLSMTNNGQTSTAQAKVITLAPASYEWPITSDNTNIAWRDFIDINQDGNAELVSKSSPYNTFFEYKDGKYSQIRKSWNSDLSVSSYSTNFFFGDFNHDGFPDFYYDGAQKGNVYYNSGEADNGFDYEKEETENIKEIKTPLIDINNDGHLGTISISGCYTQKGNSLTFEENKLKNGNDYIYIDGYFDFNRDGSIDLWANVTDYDRKMAQTIVYLKNQGTANSWDFDGKIYYENSHKFGMEGFADFNNDGYPDGYFTDRQEDGSINMVIVKGKPMDEWPCTQTVAIPLKDYKPTILDFDNNGYLDILTGNQILLMDKDFNYTTINNVDLSSNVRYQSYDFDEYHWMPLTRGAYPNGFKSSIKNEAPSMPSNVTASMSEEGMLLKWDDATDDYTPWMQMRYNVSLKKKGQTGKDAFILSPMNGLSDEATICTGMHYRKATQLVVPTTALEDGQTYEVQVQAIDLMGEHSAMTKPVEFTYQAEGRIVGDDNKFYAGLNHIFIYRGATHKDFYIDPGEDGVIKNRYDNTYGFTLSWKTPGVKTITIKDGDKTVSRMLNVKETPDLNLNLPESGIFMNTPLTVKVPKCFNAAEFDKFGFMESDAYKVSYTMGDSIATITFKKAGNIKVEPYVLITNWNYIQEQGVSILDAEMPEAEIKSIEADGKNYRINWNSNDLHSDIDRVEISRETNRLNQFETIDIVDASSGTYVDAQSDNRVQAQRYRIRLIAKNGMQTSEYSMPHNPLHVMINKTTNGFNLMWNKYEGLDVESYTIMRGTDSNKLKAIAEVAGSQQNYTDTNAPDGINYYTISFRTAQATSARDNSRAADIDEVSSNVISSEEAQPTTMATSIHASTVESVASLSQSQQQLHLTASILPTYSTYNQVRWAIVSGSELASISQSGLLTAQGGKGDVVVRVTTLDGSNLSDEITIPCDVNILATDIDIRCEKKTIQEGESILLSAVVTPRNATTKDVRWESSDPNIATIDENGILKGLALGTVRITAYAKDGSATSSWITIQIEATTGINAATIDSNKPTEYYDLEGRKIARPMKGHIYITNKGKKIVF